MLERIASSFLFLCSAFAVVEAGKLLESPGVAAPLLATAGLVAVARPQDIKSALKIMASYAVAVSFAFLAREFGISVIFALLSVFIIFQAAKIHHPPAYAMVLFADLNVLAWDKLIFIPLVALGISLLALWSGRFWPKF